MSRVIIDLILTLAGFGLGIAAAMAFSIIRNNRKIKQEMRASYLAEQQSPLFDASEEAFEIYRKMIDASLRKE